MPIVWGMTSSRIWLSTLNDGSSLPLPTVGMEISATFPSLLTEISVPGRTPPVVAAADCRSCDPAATGPLVTSSAWTATSTTTAFSGKAP